MPINIKKCYINYIKKFIIENKCIEKLARKNNITISNDLSSFIKTNSQLKVLLHAICSNDEFKNIFESASNPTALENLISSMSKTFSNALNGKTDNPTDETLFNLFKIFSIDKNFYQFENAINDRSNNELYYNNLDFSQNKIIITSTPNDIINFKTGQTKQESLGKPENGFTLIDYNYWETLKEKQKDHQEVIKKKFYLCDTSYTHTMICLDEIVTSDLEKPITFSIPSPSISYDEYLNFGMVIITFLDKACENFCQTLIKVFSPPGEGKTVFLGKLAYFISNKNLQNWEIYYFKDDSDVIIDNLLTILETLKKNILLFIDTPSEFSDSLNKKFHKITTFQKNNFLSTVVLIADQELTYNNALSQPNNSFEGYFSEIYFIDFHLSEDVLLKIYNKITESVIFKDEAQKNIASDSFFYNKNFATRERIYSLQKYLNETLNVKHRFDWEIWNAKTQFNKLNGLFSFIAFLKYFEIEFSISLFNEDYLNDVNTNDIINFISSTEYKDIIKLRGDKLSLRHGHIPLWFFNIRENKTKAKNIIDNIIKIFKEKLDKDGCHIIRNLLSKFKKVMNFFSIENITFDSDDLYIALIKYYEKYKKERNNDVLFKVLMELAKYYDVKNPGAENNWLKSILNEQRENVYAITFMVRLLTKNNKYIDACKLIADYMKISEHSFEYYNGLLIITNYIKDISPDIGLILLERLINNENDSLSKRAKYEKAKILNMLSGESNINKAIETLIELSDKNVNISASILLSNIYRKVKNDIDKAIEALNQAINKKPNTVYFYSALLNLYNSKEYQKKYDNYKEIIKTKMKEYFSLDCPGLKSHLLIFEADIDYQNENVKEAISKLNNVITANPLNIYAIQKLAKIYKKLYYSTQEIENLKKSTEILEKGLNNKRYLKNKSFGVALGINYILLKQYEKAENILENYYNIYTEYEAILKLLMKLYGETQNYEKLNIIKTKINGINRLDKSKKSDDPASISKKYLQRSTFLFYSNNLERMVCILHEGIDYLLKIIARETNNELLIQYKLILIELYDSYPDSILSINNVNVLAKKRNNLIIELYKENPQNIKLVILIKKIFVNCNKKCIALTFLESISNPEKYSNFDQLDLLLQKRDISIFFNDIKTIQDYDKLIYKKFSNDPLINHAKKNIMGQKYTEASNFILLSLWNVGWLVLTKNLVFQGEVNFEIDKKYINVSEENYQGKIYFAKYEIDEQTKASIVEYWFDKDNISDLLNQLPNKLRMLQYQKKDQ